ALPLRPNRVELGAGFGFALLNARDRARDLLELGVDRRDARLGAADVGGRAREVFLGGHLRELALVGLAAGAVDQPCSARGARRARSSAVLTSATRARSVVSSSESRADSGSRRDSSAASWWSSRFCSSIAEATSSPLPPLTVPSGRATVPSNATTVTPGCSAA